MAQWPTWQAVLGSRRRLWWPSAAAAQLRKAGSPELLRDGLTWGPLWPDHPNSRRSCWVLTLHWVSWAPPSLQALTSQLHLEQRSTTDARPGTLRLGSLHWSKTFLRFQEGGWCSQQPHGGLVTENLAALGPDASSAYLHFLERPVQPGATSWLLLRRHLRTWCS